MKTSVQIELSEKIQEIETLSSFKEDILNECNRGLAEKDATISDLKFQLETREKQREEQPQELLEVNDGGLVDLRRRVQIAIQEAKVRN